MNGGRTSARNTRNFEHTTKEPGEHLGGWLDVTNLDRLDTRSQGRCGGDRSSIFPGGGLPPSPVIGIVPVDGQPTAILIGAVQRDGTIGGAIKPSKIVPPIIQDRSRTYKSINSDK